MSNDEEGSATGIDGLAKLRKAEMEAERHRAEVTRLSAENRGLQADIRHLQAEALDRQREQEKFLSYQEDLRRRLALAEQRRAEAEKMLAIGQRQLDLLQATEEPETDLDRLGLPDTYWAAMRVALERFAEGYAEYGPGAADALGLAGQWGDLHRKVMKLKRSMWSGEHGVLIRENEEDILNDIIGHCLLALDMLNRGFEGGK